MNEAMASWTLIYVIQTWIVIGLHYLYKPFDEGIQWFNNL